MEKPIPAFKGASYEILHKIIDKSQNFKALYIIFSPLNNSTYSLALSFMFSAVHISLITATKSAPSLT